MDKAIALLHEVYDEDLDEEEMACSYHAMHDWKNARSFVSMPAGRSRDIWLADLIEDQQEIRAAKKQKRRADRELARVSED
jgi:hypothetical protein